VLPYKPTEKASPSKNKLKKNSALLFKMKEGVDKTDQFEIYWLTRKRRMGAAPFSLFLLSHANARSHSSKE